MTRAEEVKVLTLNVDELSLGIALAEVDEVFVSVITFQDILTRLKHIDQISHLLVLGILIVGIFEDLEILLHLVEIFSEVFGPREVLIQEKIKVDFFVKLELSHILGHFLELSVVIDSVDLEHEHVWWSANPSFCLKHLALL